MSAAEWKPKHPSIHAAVVAAAAATSGVSKSARNDFSKYDYTSAESMILHSKAPLADAGLTAMCTGFNIHKTAVDPYMKADYPVAVCTFVLVWEGGETMEQRIDWPIIPKKGTPLDKSAAAALTTAHGYYLRGLLGIPRGMGEDDMDRRKDDDHERGRTPQRNDVQRRPGPKRPSTFGRVRQLLSRANCATAEDASLVVDFATGWRGPSFADAKQSEDAAQEVKEALEHAAREMPIEELVIAARRASAEGAGQ